MFNLDNQKHHKPHIHAEYQGHDAVFSLEDAEVIEGNFPIKATRMVQAWIEIHKDELIADWKLAISGENIFKIRPLD